MAITNIEEYAQECAASRAQALKDRIARLKDRVRLQGEEWGRVIFHAVPYDVRVYDDERMTHAHLDYIEDYLSKPLCVQCARIHTRKTCARCDKPLCVYCEHGTHDHKVNACRECALVLRKEQEAAS